MEKLQAEREPALPSTDPAPLAISFSIECGFGLRAGSIWLALGKLLRSRAVKLFLLQRSSFFRLPKCEYHRYSEPASRATFGGISPMPKRNPRWLTAQEAAALLDSTSAQVCDLLRLGRLSGIKKKQPGRAGKAQWLVNPRSITHERKRLAKT